MLKQPEEVESMTSTLWEHLMAGVCVCVRTSLDSQLLEDFWGFELPPQLGFFQSARSSCLGNWMGIYSLRWRLSRPPFEAAHGEFCTDPTGPQPWCITSLSIHSEAQSPATPLPAGSPTAAVCSFWSEDTGQRRQHGHLAPTPERLPNFQESRRTCLVLTPQ